MAALALIVVLGSTAGFLGLSRAFRDHTRPGFGGSGRIVFGRVQLELDPTGGSSSSGPEIWSMAADGSDVKMVLAGDRSPTTPAWSPDGSRIAFLEQDPDADDLGTLRLSTSAPDGSDPTVIAQGLIEPMFPTVSWSPDGTRIAVLDSRAHDLSALDEYGIPLTEIAVYALDGTMERLVDVPGTAGGFAWWPDGEGFAVARIDEPGAPADLIRVDLDGEVLGSLVQDVAHYAPAVSPGGDRVAFVRREPPIDGSDVSVDEVWAVRADGTGLMRLADEPGRKPSLAWTPDGTRILFASQTPDRCDVVSIRSDGSGSTVLADRSAMGGCAEGISVDGSVIPSASPELDVAPETGRDIGLGFRLCHLHPLGGIDFLGDGTRGQAWTAARVEENGTCPEPSLGHTYLVIADVDGDGVADASSETVDFCFFCRPFDVVDFDVDGDDELVVMAAEGSTPTFMVYDVHGADGALRIEPVLVAEPGHPEARIDPGAPLTFSTGGDEGFAGWVGCDGVGGEVILEVRWRDHPIEGDTQEVHETGLALRENLFHVVRREDYTLPAGSPVPGASNEPACGVDWQL